MIVGFSIFVNDQPYWNRSCHHVNIHVDDATGLRRKSPVKTLGLEIGYIHAVNLDGDKVIIDVCVTAPVKITGETHAYIKSLGFLGDRFLELKPVDMIESAGKPHVSHKDPESSSTPTPKAEEMKKPDAKELSDSVKGSASGIDHELEKSLNELKKNIEDIHNDKPDTKKGEVILKLINSMSNTLFPAAHAADDVVTENKTLTASRDSEIQDTMKKVGKLVDQLTLMIGDIRELTQQKEFKETIVNLNQAMKNLEGLIRPTGKTVGNINAALESLKNSMAQAEEVMRKVNRGEGTIGKLINDPSIFDELKAAINSINLLLGKAGTLRTFVDLSAVQIPAYNGYKAKFNLMIQPNPGRYYLLGIANDPRGRDKKTTTTTTINGGTPTVQVQSVNEEKGLRVTAMFGKYFGPLDLSVGLVEDAGAVGVGYWLDPSRKFGVHFDAFAPNSQGLTMRAYGRAQIYSGIYLLGGVDQLARYKGRTPGFFGLGLFFDDDDLKYLLAFK